MLPSQEYSEEIYREKLERARRMTADQKLRAGPELFDLGRELAMSGLKMSFPGANAEELRAKMEERLEFARRRDER